MSLLLIGACGSDESAEELPPDVAIILIDTLRKDFLDLYGAERETAPYLLRLGESSAVFDRAYSTSSWTAPATASVMTGLYPQRHGVVLGFNAYGKEGEDAAEIAEGAQELEGSLLSKLPDAITTIGELFQFNGYQTFGVASNVNLAGERGFHRGFGRFETSVQADATVLRDKMAEWAGARRSDRPALWYLHLNDVHKPYDGRDPWYQDPGGEKRKKNQDAIARYTSEISYVDSVLETLGTTLGWNDETVILVIADHGEEFRDHRGSGHRFKLYGELMNVPMMIRVPGLTDAGLRIDHPVSLVDVLPTLQDLFDLDDSSERDGVSLAPLLRKETLPSRPLFAHRRKPDTEGAIWAVIEDRWKLLYFEDRDRSELFDALDDPLDKKSVTSAHPGVVERLRVLIESARQTEPMAAEVHIMDGGEAMLEHLREMGYGGNGEEDD